MAYEVARALCAPLDVIVVRKLRAPFQPELAMGAVGEDGARVINDAVFARTGISDRKLAEIEDRERGEVRDRRGASVTGGLGSRWRAGRSSSWTTGSPRARRRGPRAGSPVPRALPGWSSPCRSRRRVSSGGCGRTPTRWCASPPPGTSSLAGQVYDDFSEVDDEQVEELLRRASDATFDASTMLDAPTTPDASTTRGQPREADPPARDEDQRAGRRRPAQRRDQPAGRRRPGRAARSACRPEPPASSCSPTAAAAAATARATATSPASSQRAGLATLLFDLLTSAEEADRANVFDIELARRTPVAAPAGAPAAGDPPACASATSAPAPAPRRRSARPAAPRGAVGRRRLARRSTRSRRARARPRPRTRPCSSWAAMTRSCSTSTARRCRRLSCEKALDVVPGATHLFEEPGALERVAELAADWFTTHLSPGAA